MLSPSDPAPQLVHLGQAEPLGVFQDHDARVRHVHADLDHGGRDENPDGPRGEAAHDGILLRRRHSPVDEADLVLREHGLRQTVGGLNGRLEVALLALLHEGADHVRLPSGRQLLPDGFFKPAALRFVQQERPDRSSPGRLSVDHGDVEVAVRRHGERPRDRRRRHDEDVRRPSFPLKRRPLDHAEPVLFVDDGEAQGAERDVVLDQGVRPDGDRNRAAGQPFKSGLPLLLLHSAPQEGQRNADRLQGPPQIPRVLIGQDFRRHHERGLIAALHGRQHGHERHHGLPRSHVPLKEPVHRVGRCHVGRDLADHPFLGRREGERQRCPQGTRESPVCLESDPFPLVRHGPLPPGEADLEKDQLFDDKAPMGRRVAPGERIEARPFRRKVEFADG